MIHYPSRPNQRCYLEFRFSDYYFLNFKEDHRAIRLLGNVICTSLFKSILTRHIRSLRLVRLGFIADMHGHCRRVPLVCLRVWEHGSTERHLPQLVGRSFPGRDYCHDSADVLLLAHLDPHEIPLLPYLYLPGAHRVIDSDRAMHTENMFGDRFLSLNAVPQLLLQSRCA